MSSMASSNLNNNCCVCLKKLVKGSHHEAEYANLNDHNVEVIERFANAWKEQGSQLYNECINVCLRYKEQKKEASFHVIRYRVVLSNTTYWDECKKKSQATVKGFERDESSTAGSSIRSSNTSQSSTSDPSCLSQAGNILREEILKLPNGIFNDYSDGPMLYTFFANLCEVDTTDMPSNNVEINEKILFLCQEFAMAVHKHENQEYGMDAKADLAYLAHLVTKAVLSRPS